MRAVALPLSWFLLTACSADSTETWLPPTTEAASPLAAEPGPEKGASRGVLGGYEHGRVWGWAAIVGHSQPVEVRIDVDGQPVATAVAAAIPPRGAPDAPPDALRAEEEAPGGVVSKTHVMLSSAGGRASRSRR